MTENALPRFGLFNTEAFVVHSRHTDQDYQIGVWFPFSYAGSQRSYPVLYVPDGEFAFPTAAGLIPTLMGAGEVPEMLVVGIAYHDMSSGPGNWEEFGVQRGRDLVTQQFQSPPHQSRYEQYACFYQEELFPLIESQYRADPQERAVFGFSSGGFFALHMLLTRPGMFRRCAAASCTWPGAGEFHLENARRYAELHQPPPADLFLGVGSQDEGQVERFDRLTGMLAGSPLPGLRFTSAVFEGEGHSAGVMAKTFLSGVKAVFAKG